MHAEAVGLTKYLLIDNVNPSGTVSLPGLTIIDQTPFCSSCMIDTTGTTRTVTFDGCRLDFGDPQNTVPVFGTTAGAATKLLASGEIKWLSSKNLDFSNGIFNGVVECKDSTAITTHVLSMYDELRRPDGVNATGYRHKNFLLTDGSYTFPPGLARPGFVSGRYYGGLRTNSMATFALSANILYCGAPIYIGKRQAFTAIGIYITAGTAGNIRFGLYKADGTGGQPGTLLLDAGAMAQSIAAQNDIAIAQTLEQGWYWPALVIDVACTVNAIGSGDVSGFFSGYTDGNIESSRLTVAHTYGALPTPFGTVSYSTASSQPNILLKV